MQSKAKRTAKRLATSWQSFPLSDGAEVSSGARQVKRSATHHPLFPHVIFFESFEVFLTMATFGIFTVPVILLARWIAREFF